MNEPNRDHASANTPGPDNVLTVSGEFNLAHELTELRMPDGTAIRVPTALLAQGGGPVTTSREHWTGGAIPDPQDAAEEFVIPLLEEHLVVGKRTIPTGTVRLQKTVHEYQEALDEPLAVNTFDIERVILNSPIESLPAVRQEGDTTIYPLVEEQLILTKQLILKEEVRVTRRQTERRDTQVVTLRREHLTVEREPVEKDQQPVADKQN